MSNFNKGWKWREAAPEEQDVVAWRRGIFEDHSQESEMSEGMEYEQVYCKCGKAESIPKGHLTEEGKKAFKCAECRRRDNMPMESRVAEEANKGKRLLTED